MQLKGKIPPHNDEAEKAVLGACLIERDAFETVNSILDANCFYSGVNRAIYGAFKSLNSKGSPIDVLTVLDELLANKEAQNQFDEHYVVSLSNFVVSSAHLTHHCRMVLQAYMKRELIRAATDLITEGYESGTDSFQLLEKAENILLAIRKRTELTSYRDITSILVDTLKHLESIRHRETHLTGVTSGFPELDKITCGWQPSDLIILAARPSVGKTAFSLNLAINAAKTVPVGFFSLEMSERQLAHRVLSSEANILLWNIRNGKMQDNDMKELYEKGIKPIAQTKIYIDDTANLKLSELKGKIRRMVTKDLVKIIFIDYLQLITVSETFSRKDLEIGHISSQLKGIAKELNVPIIALSQLSRDVEKRGANEPKLSDLRESGAIEQDADMVMFLWRPNESEVMENPELSQFCNMKIEKHRNGTLEKFVGKFVKEYQRWDYLKVLDGHGMPIGETWKPVKLAAEF